LRWLNTYEEEIAAVYQRTLAAEDFVSDGLPHPRDLPLTGAAYKSLLVHIADEFAAGNARPAADWRLRFPHLVKYFHSAGDAS
jgi:hypothetical protein